MADQVLFEANDDLSESNLGLFFGQPNVVDYVVRGVSSSIDFGNNTVDYTQGEVVVTDSNNEAYMLSADARSGLSLTDSATNHVFVEYDPTTDDSITFTINTTGSSPTDPHVKIEEIDTSADTSTEFNRNPDVGIDQLTDDVDADGNDINNVGALDTGEQDTTGETVVVGARNSTNDGISSGTWVNIVDAESEDNLNEFNSSQQFAPGETTDYKIRGSFAIRNHSAGDDVRWRVRDVDAGSTLTDTSQRRPPDTSPVTFHFAVKLELTAGQTYEVQMENVVSSFDLIRGRVEITKEVVHS